MNHQFQTVTLRLSDGSTATYSGRAQMPVDKQLKVVEVIISEPQDLPKGMTIDATPLATQKIDISVPPCLQTEAFRAAWAEWQAYRRQKRQTLTKISMRRQLDLLASWGEEGAIAAIRRSIENGWTGVFAPEIVKNRNGVDEFVARHKEGV